MEALLQITDHDGQRIVPVDKPRFTIGRRTASDLRVASTDVSRQHAELTVADGRFVLRDIGSRCGTFVNGERITAHVLSEGDRIRLGYANTAEMVFIAGSPHAAAAPLSEAAGMRHVAAILDGLRALGSGRVLDEVLTRVLDAALEVTGAERGFVMLANASGELEFKAGRAAGQVTLPGSIFATSSKIPREVYANGQVRLVPDLTDEAVLTAHDRTVAHGIRHVLCVPLRVTPPATSDIPAVAPRTIGVLYFDGRDRSRLLSPHVVSALEAFGTQAAIAIESTRLYAADAEKARIEQDLRVAAEMQRALLPPPEFTGTACTLAAVSLPSRAVGGDFFDYVELPDGIAFVLGDVVGKGTAAALIAAVVQSTFAAQVSTCSDPADAIRRINDAVLRRSLDARFTTMFYGVLRNDGTLRYCNAGHEPPAVLHGEDVAWLETGGPVVGLLQNAAYQTGTVTLAAGDLLVICSDGVTEGRNVADEEFGRTRVAQAALERRGLTPALVRDGIVSSLRRFCSGVPLHDDVTAMVIRQDARGISA